MSVGEGEPWRRAAAELSAAASSGGRARLGRFSLEGTRLCERALRAGWPVETALVAASYAASRDPRERALLAELAAAGAALHVAPDAEVERLVGGRTFGALLALVRAPEPPPLAELARPRTDGRRALLLVAVDLEDPGNVGALVRTALASGAAGLVAVGATDPWHPKAVRTSMGGIFKLPLLARASAAELVAELRAAGVASWGAIARGGVPLPEVRLGPGPAAVWLGCESAGLADGLAAELDGRLSVPQAEGVDSFSVNAAAAVVLYELLGRGG